MSSEAYRPAMTKSGVAGGEGGTATSPEAWCPSLLRRRGVPRRRRFGPGEAPHQPADERDFLSSDYPLCIVDYLRPGSGAREVANRGRTGVLHRNSRHLHPFSLSEISQQCSISLTPFSDSRLRWLRCLAPSLQTNGTERRTRWIANSLSVVRAATQPVQCFLQRRRVRSHSCARKSS
jgi:hypothetical protein